MTEINSVSLPDALERAAKEHPDVPFLADSPWKLADKEVRTQGEFAAHVIDLADRLWAAGIRAGDELVICKRNHIDVLGVAIAAMRVGAVPVLLSERLLPDELLASFALLNKPYAIFDDHTASQFAGIRDRLSPLSKTIFSLTATQSGWLVPATKRAPHERYRGSHKERTLVNHTSGTTGAPKLPAHSHESLYVHAAAVIALSRGVKTPPGNSLRCLSFVHVRACSALLVVLELAMPLMAVSDPTPSHVKKILLSYRPATIETHPNIYLRWEELASDPDRPLSSVRRYISTFDAVHPRTVRALIAGSDQPDVVYLQGYGQTECGPITINVLTRSHLATVGPRSVGFALPGYTQVRVVDADGKLLEPGQIGQVEVLTSGLQLGYLGREGLARGSWWSLCDAGRLDKNGTLELLDRVFDQATGRPSLLALEDRLLETLPELIEVVFVKPETSKLAAVVCARDDAPLDMKRWNAIAAELEIADVPVHQRTWDQIPFTGTWKVRRNLLARDLDATAAQ